MALKEDEEVSLVQEDTPAQNSVGDESGAVPTPPPSLGREEKRDLSLVGISAIVIVIFLVAVSAIYVIARPAPPTGGVNYRLPPGATPLTYELHVKVCLEKFHFWGTNKIVLNVTQPLKVITLHSSGLNITAVSLSNGAATQQSSKIAFEEETEFLILSFPDLEAWTKQPVQLTLLITYDAPLETRLGGLYRSFYEENNKRRWLALTDFEPTGARHAFPCFDEPALKARWTITLTVQDEYSAISNMPAMSDNTTGDGWRVISFAQSVPISTYLVCFVVSDFAAVSGVTTDGIAVSVWSTPGTVEQCRYALECAVDILGNLTKYFDIPYPLPKMDLVAVPDFSAGAMENWGIVTFRQVLLISNDGDNSASQKEGIALVIAHEFGHQWFGNLVTMRWWNDLWLNEGFASFVENIGVEAIKPEWKIWEQIVMAQREPAFEADSLVTTHPIAQNVSNPLEIFQLFDAISYDKGGSVLRMLSAYLDNIEGGMFADGLRVYLNLHKYGNAETQDLWEAIAEVSNKPIPAIMDSWVNQAGYPYLALSATEGGYIATQKRFFSEAPATLPPEQLWFVPLMVQFENEDLPREYSLNFTRTSPLIPFTGEGAFIVDPGQTAFFRTLYPDAILAKLLTSDLLKPADLAGLLCDQFAFIQAGIIDAPDVFPTLNAVNSRQSRDLVVWQAVALGLGHMRAVLLTDPVYPPFETFVQNLVADVVAYVGWDVQPSDSHLVKLLRPTVLSFASSFGYPPVLSMALNIFTRFRTGNLTTIHPDVRGIVYAAALKLGGEAEWNWMLQRYLTSTQIAEKLRALRSLPATSNQTLLMRTLQISLDESIVRSQDVFSLVLGVSSNPLGGRLAWDFFVSSYAVFEQRFVGQMWFDSALHYLASGFTTKEDYDMVEKFFKEHDLLTRFRGANQALESINTNIAYLSRNAGPLRTYFGVSK